MTPPADPTQAPSAEATLDFVLFVVHGVPVTWADVLAAGEFLGLLAPWFDDIARVDSVLALPEEERPPFDADAAQELLTQLRYHHGLITAEETSAWLASRQLTMQDLQTFLRDSLWRGEAEPAPLGAPPRPLPADADLARRLWIDITMRDGWGDLLPPIQRRYLVELLRFNDQPPTPEQLHEAEGDFCLRQRITRMQLKAQLGRSPFIGDRWQSLLQREAAYQQYAADIASPDNCRKRLPALRTDLYLVNFEAAHFDLLDVVREAYLCVSVDGETVASVTARAGGTYSESAMFVEDLPEDLEQFLVSARAGELLDPIAAASGGYYLVNLREKREPSLDTPEVVQRVRHHLVDETFKPYLEEAVSWPRWQLIA